MRNITRQQSKPSDITNSVLTTGKRDLQIDRMYETFRSMEYDPVISGALLYLKSLLTRDFKLVPHEKATAREKSVTEALNKSLNNMEVYSKREFLNCILTMLSYGSSLFEVVYKREGNILVWDNISPIALQDVINFRMKKGKLESVKVINPFQDSELITNLGETEVNIKADKLLHFKLNADPMNPLGRSLLFPVYFPWKSKQVISELQIVGCSKSFSNTLALSVPDDYLNSYLNADPNSEQAKYMEYLFESMELMSSGARSYAVLPSNVWTGEGAGGQAQFKIEPISNVKANDWTADQTIQRLNEEMLLAMSSSLLSLGQESSGSYSLAEEKSNVVALVIKNIQETISDSMMKAVKVAFDLNSLSFEHLPSIEFERIEDPDLETVSKYFNRLAVSGCITPDENLESHLREVARAPKADYAKTLNTESNADPVERADEEKQL